MKEWLVPPEPQEFLTIQFGAVITAQNTPYDNQPLVVIEPAENTGQYTLVNTIKNLGSPEESIEFMRGGSIAESSITQVLGFLGYDRTKQAWRQGLIDHGLFDDPEVDRYMRQFEKYAEDVRYRARIIRSGPFRRPTR